LSDKYLPTGNEYVSIPTLRESDAAVESFNFLHMGLKGLIEIGGAAEGTAPLMRPVIEINGEALSLSNIQWERLNYWIPSWTAHSGKLEIQGTVLAPVGERGFVYHLRFINHSDLPIRLDAGTTGIWSTTRQTINESKLLHGTPLAIESNWNKSVVFDFSAVGSIFAFAPIFTGPLKDNLVSAASEGISYRFMQTFVVEPGAVLETDQFWGIGYEEVAAATAAKEMMRRGYRQILEKTLNWLATRTLNSKEPRVNTILNTNLFFNFFYASGITLDTEELVLATSRSPRYYVSAAYWDRDSLLWSFPSILMADSGYARQILDYVFTKQIRNVGTHSRYIDGMVLEPGFELDELCAPVIALDHYVQKTGEESIFEQSCIVSGIARILKKLLDCRHPELLLYETFLQPTDDEVVYPYLTYDNVLVWKVMTILEERMNAKAFPFLPNGFSFASEAESVRSAIHRHCIQEYRGAPFYAWSIDIAGKWNVYDEPPGSLQLLPFYGFCESSDPVYRHTLDVIRDPAYPYSFYGSVIADIGCEHAPHPWILSLANGLLCGRRDHFLNLLPHLKMDNGIACESVDEQTGESTTGDAFATCAGFLAFSIAKAFGIEQ